jgi:DNA replication protein DnaC
MYASLADRSTRQLLKRLARLDVLLIDEFGYLNLKPEQSNIFFKLMEERSASIPRSSQPTWVMTSGPTSWAIGPWWRRC